MSTSIDNRTDSAASTRDTGRRFEQGPSGTVVWRSSELRGGRSAPLAERATALADRKQAIHQRKMVRPLRLVVACLAALVPVACGPDPEKRNPVTAEGAVAPRPRIATILELDQPPGNVTAAEDGRVFFTFHPAAEPEIHVAEVTTTGKYEPFPNEDWQFERQNGPSFVSPLSLRMDTGGRLWVLDHADFGGRRPSLTAFDISTRAMVHRFEFPPEIAGRGSMLNDFWVDDTRGVAYIADTSPLAFDPALVVYDIGSGKARRLLEDHVSVRADDHHTIVQGRFLEMFGLPLRIAVDSIALSVDRKTLYFGSLTGATMYAIDTRVLIDDNLSAADVEGQVRRHGPKPATDGIAADSSGNLYLTAIEHDAIWRMSRDGSLSVLADDRELLSWPDGIHLSATEDSLYVSASELQHVLAGDLERLPDQRPFRLLRIGLEGSNAISWPGTAR